jgi:cytochrome P450
MQEMAHTYGDMACLHLGPYRIYFLNHPDYLHEMLVQQAGIMRKPRTLSRPIAEFLGNGLLISDGAYWQQQRRLVQPAFHQRQIQGYVEIMATCTETYLELWRHGHTYDIDHEFMKLNLELVTRTLFSSDLVGDSDAVADAVKTLQRISYNQGQSALKLPLSVPLPHHRQKQRAIRLLDRIVMRIIHTARQNGHQNDDLLSLLLYSTTEAGQPLTDEQVRDEVMTVLLAGHESTANAMSWMWYLLVQHPEVASKLSAEIEYVVGDRRPSAAELKQMPYAAMISREALRLYPPAWALPRENTADTQIGGFRVPKGSLLLGIPFIIQRDGRYFSHPDQFQPERFADDAERHLPRHVYLPFGSGPRFCIGNAFALTAMQITLIMIHQRFELCLLPGQRIELDPLLTLRPRYGIHMQVNRREYHPVIS